MRKAIVTAAGPRMAAALELALPTFRRFAALHAYALQANDLGDLAGDDETDPVRRRRVRWRKIALLRAAVETFDLVLWLDADTVIRRFGRDIADDLPPHCFQGLVRERFATRDNPNTGVWVLRGGPEASRFLREVAEVGQLAHSWADQAAVCAVLGWDLGDYHGHGAQPRGCSAHLAATAWLPAEWNAVQEVPGARIRHFAGMAMPERLEAMRAEAATP